MTDEIYIIEKYETLFLTHILEEEVKYFCLTDLKESIRPGDLYQGRVQRLEGSRAWVDIGQPKPALLRAPHQPLQEAELICVRIDRTQTFSALGLKGCQVTQKASELSKESQKVGLLKAAPEKWLSYINLLKTPTRILTNSEKIFHLLKELTVTHKIILKSDIIIPSSVLIAWQALLDPWIEIPGGGQLLIEEGETLTAIDVNTSTQGDWLSPHFKHNRDWLKFNLQAASVIQTQLELRQIGGIIIIDFPELRDKKHRDLVYEKMKELGGKSSSIFGFTRAGLFEMTRRKEQDSLPRRLRALKERIKHDTFF